MSNFGEVRMRLLNTIDGMMGTAESELGGWRNVDASAPMCLWWAGYLKACAEARRAVLRIVPWTAGGDVEEEICP